MFVFHFLRNKESVLLYFFLRREKMKRKKIKCLILCWLSELSSFCWNFNLQSQQCTFMHVSDVWAASVKPEAKRAHFTPKGSRCSLSRSQQKQKLLRGPQTYYSCHIAAPSLTCRGTKLFGLSNISKAERHKVLLIDKKGKVSSDHNLLKGNCEIRKNLNLGYF